MHNFLVNGSEAMALLAAASFALSRGHPSGFWNSLMGAAAGAGLVLGTIAFFV
jgi:uncharacterized membrane-anchored protein YjiN (DUF445 family)